MIKRDMLKQLFEDDQLIDRYIQVFKVETPKMIQSIFDSLDVDDFENVSIVAHGLKSQLAYLENEEAKLIASEMEVMADSADKYKHGKLMASAFLLERILNRIIENI